MFTSTARRRWCEATLVFAGANPEACFNTLLPVTPVVVSPTVLLECRHDGPVARVSASNALEY